MKSEPHLKLLDNILKLNQLQQIFILEKIYENLMNKIETKNNDTVQEILPTWLCENLDYQIKLLKQGKLKTQPWTEVKNELLENLQARKLERI